MSQKILNKRSSVFNKTPLPSQIEVGEIAINFNHENPFLSILDSNGEIQKFLSETKTRGLIQEAKEDIDNSFYSKEEINNMFEAFDPSGEVDLSLYYTKVESDSKYQPISGMSSYLTVASAENLYQPKGNYLTEHQSLENYYTKSEADNKFLTSHQDLSDYLTIASASTTYATKEELEKFTPTVDAYSKEETDTLLAGKASSAHTHDYETLTNKPDLSIYLTEHQDISGLATKQELEDYQMKSGMSAYLLASEAQETYQPKGTYVVPSDLNNYVTSGYAEETFAKKGEVPSDSYTKAETDTLLQGKANSAHTHTMSEITDLDIPKTWRGTLAQYNNLTEIDNDTLYIITDSSEQLVTSGDVESMISGYTNLTEVQTLLEGYSTTAHTHDYSEILNTPDLSGFASLSDIPDTSNFITSGFCEDRYQPKGTYVVPSDLNDYALKSDLPTVPDSYTKTETDNLLADKANSAHTHSYTALTDLPDLSIYLTEQDISGLATKQELENYMPNSGMTDYVTDSELNTALEGYSQTGHTHSQYLTQTSADTRYARVVSLTQTEYDALVQNDQVEQGVLYCIIEQSNS